MAAAASPARLARAVKATRRRNPRDSDGAGLRRSFGAGDPGEKLQATVDRMLRQGQLKPRQREKLARTFILSFDSDVSRRS